VPNQFISTFLGKDLVHFAMLLAYIGISGLLGELSQLLRRNSVMVGLEPATL